MRENQRLQHQACQLLPVINLTLLLHSHKGWPGQDKGPQKRIRCCHQHPPRSPDRPLQGACPPALVLKGAALGRGASLAYQHCLCMEIGMARRKVTSFLPSKVPIEQVAPIVGLGDLSAGSPNPASPSRLPIRDFCTAKQQIPVASTGVSRAQCLSALHLF